MSQFIIKFLGFMPKASTTLLLLFLVFPSITQALNVDIENGSLKDLAAWTSNQTNKNIVLGPGVDSEMSVYCPDVDQGDEYQVFKNAVISSGFSIIEKGNYVTVINSESIKKDAGGLQDEKQTLSTKLINLKNISVDTVIDMLNVTARSYNAAGSVQRLSGSNSILLVSDPQSLDDLSSLVAVIDRQRPQVLIEAVIFETRQGEGQEIGVDLEAVSSDFSVGSLFSDLFNLPPGGYLSFDDPGKFNALVKALQSNDLTRLLSTPSILVTSSESARISVGQNVPFVTGRVNIEGTAQPVETIERHDVGVSLQVLPFVLDNGLIDLQVNQVSSSVNSSAIASDLITNQRSISTRLNVIDGQYFILGGLIGEEDRDQVNKIPLLGSIPFIGKLFQSRSTEKVRSKLNVILRVTIV